MVIGDSWGDLNNILLQGDLNNILLQGDLNGWFPADGFPGKPPGNPGVPGEWTGMYSSCVFVTNLVI